jgi:demethylmenaquinone methyltransferase/2-methoxy-6-polyprenyl-1,4-benzoquinol methylase
MVERMAKTQKEPSGAPETTHFGFRRVEIGEKAGLVRAVFDSVADRYDLMNDLMSVGVHRLWKAALIDWLAPRAGIRLLDVAGGTGDVAFGVLARVGGAEINTYSGGAVTICDINETMLKAGRAKARNRGLEGGVRYLGADAEALAVADGSVDAYTVAFGLRNVTRLDAALGEALRVLKPGGRFLCLEFSRVSVPLLGEIYDRYSFAMLPRIGEIVTGNADAYRYLAESIRRFPPQDTFATMITAAGFDQVKYRDLSGGIAALHSAWRL